MKSVSLLRCSVSLLVFRTQQMSEKAFLVSGLQRTILPFCVCVSKFFLFLCLRPFSMHPLLFVYVAWLFVESDANALAGIFLSRAFLFGQSGQSFMKKRRAKEKWNSSFERINGASFPISINLSARPATLPCLEANQFRASVSCYYRSENVVGGRFCVAPKVVS